MGERDDRVALIGGIGNSMMGALLVAASMGAGVSLFPLERERKRDFDLLDTVSDRLETLSFLQPKPFPLRDRNDCRHALSEKPVSKRRARRLRGKAKS